MSMTHIANVLIHEYVFSLKSRTSPTGLDIENMYGKHRRCRDASASATPSATTSTTVVQTSCWATMDKDMLRLIAQCVLSGDFTDHAAFRAVCKHWWSSSACPTGHSITDPNFHPWNWMMFRMYPGNPKLEGHVRFINLSTGAFVCPFLPIFHDHCALDSVNGILLLQRGHDSAIHLLHPFTGEMVDLPWLTTLLPQLNIAVDDDRKLAHFRVICASVSISDATRVVTVMLALCKLGNLAVATATSIDQHWISKPTLCLYRSRVSYTWWCRKEMIQISNFYGLISLSDCHQQLWSWWPHVFWKIFTCLYAWQNVTGISWCYVTLINPLLLFQSTNLLI
jgi:hypothetical protein